MQVVSPSGTRLDPLLLEATVGDGPERRAAHRWQPIGIPLDLVNEVDDCVPRHEGAACSSGLAKTAAPLIGLPKMEHLAAI